MLIRLSLCSALFLLTLTAGAARAAVFYPTSFTLPNGLQVVVVPNHLAPAVNQMVWYKVGSSDEQAGKTGIAHYLEHLMFRGTSNLGPGEFSKVIAAQGGSENAFTSEDYTAFWETVAADRLPMAMELEADRMRNLQIMPTTATPELSVVLNERQERTDNNPAGRFEEKLHHILMPNYPYGVPVIGWKPEIEKLTAADANQWYQAHYAPNNAVVIITGDVTPDAVRQLASSIYGAVPAKPVPLRKDFPALPLPTSHRLTMKDAGVEQPQVELDIAAASYTTQHDNEAYALEVLAEALDNGEIGLLYHDLVRVDGIASAVDSGYDPDARGAALFTIAASPLPGTDPAKLAAALPAELRKLAAGGLDEATVTAAKERLKRSAVFARDGLMMPGYAFGMAVTTGHTVDDVEDWPNRIDAVTVGQVNAALNDLAANPHYIVASLLPDHSAGAMRRAAAHPVIDHATVIR